MKKILAFETSCDDTCVAVVDLKYNVLSSVVSSQSIHNKFGGVVPELASRDHLKNITQVTSLALQKASCSLEDISAIAVSVNPGLIGSLLVGVNFAKSLAYSLSKPLIALNHILGHISAIKLDFPDLKPPFLALVVSGGHTQIVYFESEQEYKVVGKTVDDAAGEAFDKTAKLLGLGYPGGKAIDDLAKKGNSKFVHFTRAMDKKGNYDFSFSGLKTAVMNYINSCSKEFLEKNMANIAASVQESIVDSLCKKTLCYAKNYNIKTVIVTGGVSANSRLREVFGKRAIFPQVKYCMDNAAMIGAAAVEKFIDKDFAGFELNAFSTKGISKV